MKQAIVPMRVGHESITECENVITYEANVQRRKGLERMWIWSKLVLIWTEADKLR